MIRLVNSLSTSKGSELRNDIIAITLGAGSIEIISTLGHIADGIIAHGKAEYLMVILDSGQPAIFVISIIRSDAIGVCLLGLLTSHIILHGYHLIAILKNRRNEVTGIQMFLHLHAAWVGQSALTRCHIITIACCLAVKRFRQQSVGAVIGKGNRSILIHGRKHTADSVVCVFVRRSVRISLRQQVTQWVISILKLIACTVL